MNAPRYSFAVGLLAALTAVFPMRASPLDTWHARTAPSPGIGFQGITFAGGLFVAVGCCGSSTNILTSPDGVTWTARHADTTNDLYAVTWGNGTYVAVGYRDDPGQSRYDAAVVTSLDGAVWTGQRLATNAFLRAVTFANGLFVAVGNDNHPLVMTSTNGTSWSPHPLTNVLFGIPEGVTYGNGLFVAASFSSGPVLASPDGINWTNRGDLMYGWNRAISYGNGRFVVVGGPQVECCIPLVSTSTNLDDWTTQFGGGGTHYNTAVAYGAGTWVVVGDSDRIAYSTDTLTWTQGELPSPLRYLQGVTYGKGTFVAVGDGGIWQSDPLPTARLTAGALSEQGLPLTIAGEEGLRYRLQAAPELPSTNWTDLLTFTYTAPGTNFVDTSATNFNRRFYRVVSP
jgi:hypothetical protein